jgi:hypothetical protein
MASGYNLARDAALEMGRKAFVANQKRNCFCDVAWVALYNKWLLINTKQANRLGEQWYRGWDRENCKSMIAAMNSV